MRSYYSLLAHCFCTTWLLLGLGACHSPTNSKPNDNLAVQKDTIAAGSLVPTYEIADYDTIHINGYTMYFEPYDSVGIDPYFADSLFPTVVDSNNYKSARETYELYKGKSCTNCFERVNDTLTVFALNGKSNTFIDDNSEEGDSWARYYFDGLKNGYYIVTGYFYEWGNTFIINAESGKMTTLFDYPYFSPNNKWILVANNDDSGLEENAIAYYNIISNDSIEKQFQIDISTWGPAGIKWIGNDEAIIKKQSFSLENTAPYTYTYTKMTITKP